jgi:hypothetical protein
MSSAPSLVLRGLGQLAGGPDRPVTVVGQWTQVVLRRLGPAPFALALVSLVAG